MNTENALDRRINTQHVTTTNGHDTICDQIDEPNNAHVQFAAQPSNQKRHDYNRNTYKIMIPKSMIRIWLVVLVIVRLDSNNNILDNKMVSNNGNAPFPGRYRFAPMHSCNMPFLFWLEMVDYTLFVFFNFCDILFVLIAYMGGDFINTVEMTHVQLTQRVTTHGKNVWRVFIRYDYACFSKMTSTYNQD